MAAAGSASCPRGPSKEALYSSGDGQSPGLFGNLRAPPKRGETDDLQPPTNLFGGIQDLKRPNQAQKSNEKLVELSERPFGMFPEDPMDRNAVGYVVIRIEKGSPAALAGIKRYWKLTHVNDHPCTEKSLAKIEELLETCALPAQLRFQTESLEMELNKTWCAALVSSSKFQNLTIGIIILNALAIGWDVDFGARFERPDGLYDTEGNSQLMAFAVLENVFCFYFVFEITIRFIAVKRWVNLRNAWFYWVVFDTILVTMMVLETWVFAFMGSGGFLGQLSILRLLRISRVARVVRQFPQLRMILKGMQAAVKAVFWTFILLVIITFTWAIIFTNEYHQGYISDEEIKGFAEDDPEAIMAFFGSMGKSMMALLVMGTILDDVTACTMAIRNTEKMGMLVLFILYIIINSFMMMNMLVGILVEVVGSTAQGEKQRFAEDEVNNSMMDIFETMDKDGSGLISRQEFVEMRHSDSVMKSLQQLGIKEKQFEMYTELLFQPGEDGEPTSLRKQDLIDCMLRLQPSSNVSALDFAAFKQSVFTSLDAMKDRVTAIEMACSQLSGGEDEPSSPLSPRVKDHDEPANDQVSNRPNPMSAANDARTPLLSAAGASFSSVDDQGGAMPPHTLEPASHAAAHNVSKSEGDPIKIDINMLLKIDRASSGELINELQRRLGLANLEETGVPFAMMDEDLQNRVRNAEAFQPVGVPQQDPYGDDPVFC